MQVRELSEPDLDTCKMSRAIVTLENSCEKSMWWPRQRVGCGKGVTQICHPSLAPVSDPGSCFLSLTWCFQMTVIWSSHDQSSCGGVSDYRGSSNKEEEGGRERACERGLLFEKLKKDFWKREHLAWVFWQITRYRYQDAIAVRRNRAVRCVWETPGSALLACQVGKTHLQGC